MNNRFAKQSKHTLNEFYFRKWSNEMAYILGLMAADGVVLMNAVGTNATVRFSSKDREVVELIQKAWRTDCPIREEESPRWNWHGYKIEVYSKTMAADLALLGVGRRKSFKLDFPPMRAKYKPHFIRGLFDGDGAVWVSSQHHKIRLYWAGTKSLLESIAKFFAQTCGIRLRNVEAHSSGRIFELVYYDRTEIFQISKLIYRDSDGIRLERKYVKVRDFFGSL